MHRRSLLSKGATLHRLMSLQAPRGSSNAEGKLSVTDKTSPYSTVRDTVGSGKNSLTLSTNTVKSSPVPDKPAGFAASWAEKISTGAQGFYDGVKVFLFGRKLPKKKFAAPEVLIHEPADIEAIAIPSTSQTVLAKPIPTLQHHTKTVHRNPREIRQSDSCCSCCAVT